MKAKAKKIALILAPIIVIYAIGSTIILGLTYTDWTWVIKYPREAHLILNIPLLFAGAGLGAWGESK
jgi:hypothetical protein